MKDSSTLRWLLGLDSSSTEGTDARWSLGFNALPEGPWAVAMIVGALAAIGLVWYLYRAEGRDISRLGRLLLAALRLSILALVIVMLLELVLVQTITEYLPSRLLVFARHVGEHGARGSLHAGAAGARNGRTIGTQDHCWRARPGSAAEAQANRYGASSARTAVARSAGMGG